MSEPFVAEVRIFAGNFAPRGWAFCDGQLLPISQNTALFSLIGTTYGGDGRTTTALPDLQGRAPMHPGQGPGLTSRALGQKGGVETVVLTENQIPSHTHTLSGVVQPATQHSATSNSSLARSLGGNAYAAGSPGSSVNLNAWTLPSIGNDQAHDNMQPFLALSFIIALTGIYPSRS